MRVPILALSANAMAHQIASYLDAGMDGHVAKPIEVDKLYAAIEAVIDPEPVSITVTPAGAPGTGRRLDGPLLRSPATPHRRG